MPLKKLLHRQPRWVVLLEATALVGFIGWIDFVTANEWSFFAFYALPIVLVVWRSGQRLGFVFAVLCAFIWWLGQIRDNPYQTRCGVAVAVLSRCFYFSVLAIAVAAVEKRRELDLARIASLELAQRLEGEILRTSENEQQRIGRDLHDSLGPHLAAIGYALTFLENELRERRQPEAAKIKEIREMVTEAISLTRGVARGIFPVQMDSSGLAIALEDLAQTVSRLTGISVAFCECGNTAVADPETAMHLYRIAQEAVNNAAKHGNARNVSISLRTDDGTTRLVIADDGKGMSKLTNATQGIGLESMKYRARTIHAQLRIDSNPGEGTVVACEKLDCSSMPVNAIP